jgi:hypothetical protein
MTPERAEEFHQFLLPFQDEFGPIIREMLQVVDRHTVSRNGRTFIMLYPDQNRAVVEYLLTHSSRPLQAVQVWAHCFEHLDSETGEIKLRRDEIAQLAGISAKSVSTIMGELKARDAILSRRTKIAGMRGQGAVRYYMNPNVATHLPGKARDQAQAAAPKVIHATPKQASLQLVISNPTKRAKSADKHKEKAPA